MVFEVVGIGFKSDFILAEGNIDSGRYIPNLDPLGSVDALNEKSGPFG
jgi:hypothetical protein